MKTVSIVAQGGSFFEYVMDRVNCGGAPITDEVWAINTMGGVIQHDLLFHMDDCKVQESRPNNGVKSMLSWLRKHPKFITSTAYEDYPGSIAYPLEEVVNCIGIPYLNGTVAYALAYAIYKEYDGIRLYGADFTYPFAHKAERGRGCVEFLLGIAKERGIRLHVPRTSTLLDMREDGNTKLYGYDRHDVDWEDDDGNIRIILTPKDAPTSGEEMERRYMTLEQQSEAAMAAGLHG